MNPNHVADEFAGAAPLPYRLAGDNLDGRHQFTILDATGRHIIGVDALAEVLAGYGAEADARSRCSEGQPESFATAALLVRASNSYEPMRALLQKCATALAGFVEGHSVHGSGCQCPRCRDGRTTLADLRAAGVESKP